MANHIYRIFLCVLVIVVLSACASSQPLVTIAPSPEPAALVIEASNFHFTPNNIRVEEGQKIDLRVDNTSETEHNLTVKDPGGRIIQDVTLPPKEMISVELELTEPGIYTFYCNKTFHSSLGMNGNIEVTAK